MCFNVCACCIPVSVADGQAGSPMVSWLNAVHSSMSGLWFSHGKLSLNILTTLPQALPVFDCLCTFPVFSFLHDAYCLLLVNSSFTYLFFLPITLEDF